MSIPRGIPAAWAPTWAARINTVTAEATRTRPDGTTTEGAVSIRVSPSARGVPDVNLVGFEQQHDPERREDDPNRHFLLAAIAFDAPSDG